MVEQPAASQPDAHTGARAEAQTAAPTPWMEQATAIGALALGLAIVAGGRAIDLRNETGGVDPRFWPITVGAAITAAALWMTFNAFTARRGERDVEPATGHGWRQLAAALAVTAVILGIWYAGVSFVWLAPVFLVGLNLVFGIRNLRGLVVFPALMTAFIYVIFHLVLKVPL